MFRVKPINSFIGNQGKMSGASILRGWGHDPRFLAGGGRSGSWTGLGKYYSLFWTESMLESDLFFKKEKREKIAKNVGVTGKQWKFWGYFLS